MSDCICGPGGDPGYYELNAAASCFEILKLLDLKIKSEKDIRRALEVENVCNENFIEGL